MNIPAFASETLRIGRTYDAVNSVAGIDIFPASIPTAKTNINLFHFQYEVVKNSADVRKLLDVSGELSLKVQAGLVRVQGSGKYLAGRHKEEGTAELLAVIKCTTVNETIDGLVKVADEVASGKVKHGLGTHYVRSVTYGAELVARMSIKTSSFSERLNIKGSAEGAVTAGPVNVSLKAQLKNLATQCSALSDVAITYYATELPTECATNLDDLVELIEQFPSRLAKSTNPQGIPLKFELLPINDVIQIAEPPFQHKISVATEEKVEKCFDDLRTAEAQVGKYLDNGYDDADDVLAFYEEITEVLEKFREAISSMGSSSGKDTIDACIKTYHKALGGRSFPGKFCLKWRNILKTKKLKVPTTSIMLPTGNPLTVVVVGKTGNGKSTTGNQIIGRDSFGVSDGAQSESSYCEKATRTEEREITVIDTPGIIDTSTVKKMQSKWRFWGFFRETQEKVLKELARMFVVTPRGINAILLLVRFGTRFTPEDAQALTLLKTFFGEEALNYMVLLLTHGDVAEKNARRKKVPVDEYVKEWIDGMEDWVKEFIHNEIQGRFVLMNGMLDPDENPEACKKQLLALIETIDKMDEENREPFKQSELTEDAINDRVEKALATMGDDIHLEIAEKRLEQFDKWLTDISLNEEERQSIEGRKTVLVQDIQTYHKAVEKVVHNIHAKKGGCYPGSAIFVDAFGRRRQMESLQVGEKVQVIANNKISSEPVIIFIHRQPEVMQKFLKITTLTKKVLKITEDHLLFVENEGVASAIPARDVISGDTVYVRGDQGALETDAVQNISHVYEKGVYAPVTLSGTILVNDVHTSCYFDVLSHKSSNRAMGIVRFVYRMSPWMVQWLSSMGQKDGFPGWCRVVHKILTVMNLTETLTNYIR